MLADAVRTLVEHRDLSEWAMRHALEEILTGRAHEADMAAFLTALRLRGETATHLAVAVQTLRRHAVPFPTGALEVTDTCGTGGDGRSTFNVSTGTALVVAACGVPVVKHGNRGVSSRSGSADVLEALGVKVDVPPAVARRCLEETGIAFCFAPRYHPAARHIADVRKRLGFRTMFNMVGPLINPAAAAFQLIGVGDPAWRPLLADAAAALRIKRAYVVHGLPGLDEVSLSGPTKVTVVQDGQVTEEEWQPEDFGLNRQAVEEQAVPDAAASAQVLLRILQGEGGAAADLVLANAAAVLRLCGNVETLREGVTRARAGISSGKAKHLLQLIQRISVENG